MSETEPVTPGNDFTLEAVNPGDSDGLSFLVVRSLGLGDSGRYDAIAVAEVMRRQREAGFEPTGIVDGETWGLILGDVKRGDNSWETAILRGLVGLPVAGGWDRELEDALGGMLADDRVGTDAWRYLTSGKQAEVSPQNQPTGLPPGFSAPEATEEGT